MLATGKSFKKRIVGQPNKVDVPSHVDCASCKTQIETGNLNYFYELIYHLCSNFFFFFF